MKRLKLLLVNASAAALFACADEVDPPAVTAPQVLFTEPADGARGISIDQVFRVVFSQRMRADVGEVALSTGQVIPVVQGAWSGNGQVLSVAPKGVLPIEAELTVELRGFQGLSAEPMTVARFGFRTGADAAGPYVLSTLPSLGELGVPTTGTVAITFSEPMDPRRGTISIERREQRGDALRWSADRRTVQVRTSSLAPEAMVQVATGDDFVSADGRRVVRSFSTWFETRDDVAPAVLAASPRSGTEGNIYGFSTLEFFLSEAVVVDGASVQISSDSNPDAAAFATAEIVLLPSNVLLVQLSRLRDGTEYQLSLLGFADRAGNPLDTSALGPDGHYSFSVNSDVRANPPIVVWASPAEGSRDVDPSGRRIDLHFSQPVEPGLVYLEATDGVTGSSSFPSLMVDPQNPLRGYLEVFDGFKPGFHYRIDLSPLSSNLGLGIATVPYLGDGFLDFTVGADTRAPTLIRSTPNDGQQEWYPVDVDYLYVDFAGRNGTMHRKVLTMEFSEPMDIRSSTVAIECLGCQGFDENGELIPLEPVIAAGTWSTDQMTLVIELQDGTFQDPLTSEAAPLMPNASLRIDLRSLRDRNGNPLDPVPSLLDGYLDFSTADLDPELNHTCTHYLGRSPVQQVTAGDDGAANPFLLPLSGVPHDLNVVTLPVDLGNGQFRGWVRHEPGSHCSTSNGRTTLYFTTDVGVRIRSVSGAWELEPTLETAAQACPEVITRFSRWQAPTEGLFDPLVVELTGSQPTIEYVLEGLTPELGCN